MSQLDPMWSKPFNMLRPKLFGVPAGNLPLKTTDLLSHSDEALG